MAKHIEPEVFPCQYNEGVQCSNLDCDHCGWHPAVAAARIEEFKSKGHVGHQKALTIYQLMGKMTVEELAVYLAGWSQRLRHQDGIPMETLKSLLRMTTEEAREAWREAPEPEDLPKEDSGLMEED